MHVRLRVGGEAYAFPVENVLEVTDLGAVAPLPGAATEVLGVRNLRGEVVPVFDLASLLRIERDGDARRLVIVEHDGARAGLAFDDVLGVGELAAPIDAGESPLLLGTSLDDGELLGIVDVPRLFAGLAREGT